MKTQAAIRKELQTPMTEAKARVQWIRTRAYYHTSFKAWYHAHIDRVINSWYIKA